MNEREKTIQDMKHEVNRMRSLEAHTKMFCKPITHAIIEIVVEELEMAIEKEVNDG